MKPSQKHADKIFYEMAGAEIESGQIDKGLMVKAISKSGGDKKRQFVDDKIAESTTGRVICFSNLASLCSRPPKQVKANPKICC